MSLYRLSCSLICRAPLEDSCLMTQNADDQHHSLKPTDSGSRLSDPVCGMQVTEASSHHTEYAGKSFYFCSARCLERFKHDPEKFIAAKSNREPALDQAVANTIHTCPMHPEIRQDHPGNCPKCGMALEPLMPSLDDDDNPELKDFSRRFWWTLPFSVIVMVLAMFGHQLGWFSMTAQTWIELLLSLPVVLWAGQPFFQRGWQSLINRSPNMCTLTSLGAGAAFVYSTVATVAPGLFPDRLDRTREQTLHPQRPH